MARLFEEICAKIGPPNNINSLGASTYQPTEETDEVHPFFWRGALPGQGNFTCYGNHKSLYAAAMFFSQN
jgi:hypothetical protein